MRTKTATFAAACSAVGALDTIGCGSPSDGADGLGENVDTTEDLVIGSHLRGIADADFQEAKDAFGAVEDVDDGPGDSVATTRRMRTAPLWGIRFRTKFLHDGRATDIPSSIRAHDGQAASAARQFVNLGSRDQTNLVRYVQSL